MAHRPPSQGTATGPCEYPRSRNRACHPRHRAAGRRLRRHPAAGCPRQLALPRFEIYIEIKKTEANSPLVKPNRCSPNLSILSKYKQIWCHRLGLRAEMTVPSTADSVQKTFFPGVDPVAATAIEKQCSFSNTRGALCHTHRCWRIYWLSACRDLQLP